jgi:hypothetical protein
MRLANLLTTLPHGIAAGRPKRREHQASTNGRKPQTSDETLLGPTGPLGPTTDRPGIP